MGNKTKEQLTAEIKSLRKEVAELRQEKTQREQVEEALRESEEHFRALIENSSDIIQAVDSEGAIRYLSPSVQRILGYKPEELIGRPSIDVVHPDDLPKVARGFEEAVQKPGVPVVTACRCKHKDGAWRVIEGTGINYLDNPAINGFISVMHDITEREKAEQELKESEERYRALVEASGQMGEAVVLLQNTDKVEAAHLFANQEWVRMTGYTLEELREVSYFALIHPGDRGAAVEINRRRLEGEDVPGPREISIIAKDGTELPVEGTGTPITYQGRPAVVAYIRDITERKRAEEKLKVSLEEKEVLLKEIHHRVKNNLQVISSLLKLQSGYIEDERYAEMFKDSRERVKSMALVHEKLYQSEDLARIDFAGYIEGVVEELRRSYGSERAGIGIKTEVEGIRLGVGYAIPCGLIVNELVSNSLKHAFPDGERGEVRIAMRQVGGDQVELEVSDNGVGLPESMDVRDAKSLGLRLVSILAEDQLGGEMELGRTKGTKFRIRFRVGGQRR